MWISITDENGAPLVGAEVKGMLSVSCVGYQTMLKTIDTIYNPNQQSILKMALVEDTDMQRYFISNEVAQLFGFRDGSELPADFCGLVIVKGESQGKDAWLRRVNHLPNSVVISLVKVISEKLLSLDAAVKRVRQTIEVLRGNSYNFIALDVGKHEFTGDLQFLDKIAEKVFQEELMVRAYLQSSYVSKHLKHSKAAGQIKNHKMK